MTHCKETHWQASPFGFSVVIACKIKKTFVQKRCILHGTNVHVQHVFSMLHFFPGFFCNIVVRNE